MYRMVFVLVHAFVRVSTLIHISYVSLFRHQGKVSSVLISLHGLIRVGDVTEVVL